MLVFSQDQFNQKYPENSKKSDILLHQKLYKKTITFSLSYYHKAVEYCQQFENNNYLSLLIKNPFGYTIWLYEEKIEKNKENKINESKVNKKNELTEKNTISKTKTVERLYRGTTYKVELPLTAIRDNQTPKTSSPKKKMRKYRGSYY